MERRKFKEYLKGEMLLYLAASFLIPGIPIFYLLEKNINQGILISHCIVYAIELGFISMLIYFILSKFFLEPKSTLLMMLFMWFLFWMGGYFHDKLRSTLFSSLRVRYTFLVIVMLIIILYFLLKKNKINSLITKVLSTIIVCMFILNVTNASLKGHVSQGNNEQIYKVKSDFWVDGTTEKPNIYWFHMDGMVGFEAVERYFADSQEKLKKELEKRGFVINETANLNPGKTFTSIPALTCPTFYDSYYGNLLNSTSDFLGRIRYDYIMNETRKSGFTLDEIYAENELLEALKQAGYEASTNKHEMVRSENVKSWYAGTKKTDPNGHKDEIISYFKYEDFKTLFCNASILKLISPKIIDSLLYPFKTEISNLGNNIPTDMINGDKYFNDSSDASKSGYSPTGGIIDVLTDVLISTSPKFLYYVNGSTHTTSNYDARYGREIHNTFIYDENGNYYSQQLKDPLDLNLYLPQHKYAVKQMIMQINIVLEEDPDAIIVLQADHGIHCHGKSKSDADYDIEDMERQGYTKEDMENLCYQVMSAVRIPEKYGKLTEPLDPLDISRYLVNNFVGEGNYEYLYYQKGDEK